MTLGLTFLSSGALFFLSLGLVPLIIHFLSRRRWNVVRWAAMEFLLRAMRKQRRRLRLENLLLILLRTAAIVLFVLACARPVSKEKVLPSSGSSSAEVLVAIDRSYSMGFKEAGRSVLQKAVELARRRLDELNSGDGLKILEASSFAEVVFEGRIGEDTRTRAMDLLDRMKPSHTALEPVLLLSKLARCADEAVKEGLQVRAVIFTDLQAKDWLGQDREPEPEIADAFRELVEKGCACEIVDLGSLDRANVEVADLTVDRTLVAQDVPVTITAVIRNWSSKPCVELPVELLVDGRQVQARTVRRIPPGETGSTTFRYTFREPGVYAVSVESEPDGLAIDDRRFLAVDVKERVRVLLVDGANAGERKERATYYIETALEHGGKERMTVYSPFRVETVSSVLLSVSSLEGKDAVVFADVDRISIKGALREFMSRGGAVLMFLGPNVDQEYYNRELFTPGSGIFPLQLEGISGDPNKRFAVFMEPKEFDHPVIQYFVDHDEVELGGPPVWRFFKARPGKKAQVLAAFKNPEGDPAVISAERENGSAVVVTSTGDEQWTNFPKWPDFVPLVHELLSWMVAPGEAGRNLLVGWPYSRLYPGVAYAREVWIHTPRGHRVGTSLRKAGDEGGESGGFELRYAKTDEAGVYKIRLERQGSLPEILKQRYPDKDLFVVNLRGGEGDLSPTTESELKGAYGEAAPLVSRPGEIKEVKEGAASPRNDLWTPLLIAALLFFLGEGVCAAFFGRRHR